MDDKDLEEALANIPLPSVVLLEIIDVSSADVKSRSTPVEKKSQAEEDDKAIDNADAVRLINKPSSTPWAVSRRHISQK